MADEIRKEVNQITRRLFFRGYFHLEGSASLEELFYLAELTRRRNAKLIAETGFNAGFSSFAFLSANPDARVTSFDIGTHVYTKSAKRYIDKKFPGRHTL